MTTRCLAPLASCSPSPGCNDDVCARYDGKTCIALDVRGGAGTTLSTLHVLATAGFTLDSLDSRDDNAVLALPIHVAIVPGDLAGDFPLDFTLEVTAQLGSSVVGQAIVDGTLEENKHVRIVAELDGPPADDMSTVDSSGADMASPDMARIVTPDSECGNGSAWVGDMKSDSSCAARHAAPIDTTVPNLIVSDVDKIHIARASTGRVGIVSRAFGDGGPDSIALVVSQFTGAAWPPTVSTAAYGGANIGERQGSTASIAVGGDGIHVCNLDASDTGIEIHHTTVTATGEFAEPEIVAVGVGASSTVAIALRADGTVFCAYYDSSDFSLHANARTPGASGAWGTQPNLVVDGAMPPATTVGTVALVSAGSTVSLGGQVTRGAGAAVPVFSTHSATGWASFKQLDNQQDVGIYGQDAHIAVFGSQRAETYFVPSNNGADLRVATFSSSSDTPALDIVYAGAATTVTGARHAVAFDSFGLLHVAIITPDANMTTTASLLYLRQYPDGKGGLRWLSDLVDPMAGGGDEGTFSVDLIVDENDRPHITYYSGERGRVMYATRTDRP